MRTSIKRDSFRILTGGGIRAKLTVLPQLFLMGILLLASAHAFADDTTISTGDVEINNTNFPDEAFRNYVLNTIAGGSTTLTQAMINKTTNIDLKGLDIKDLTGLKYFTALKILYCQDKPDLTTIDLSGNKKLEVLNITGSNGVTSLDFSQNPNMTSINCAQTYKAPGKLTSINVSKCGNLQYLYLAYQTKLATLNLTNNTDLVEMSINNTVIKDIDLSKNVKLKSLMAFNIKGSKVIDFTNNTNLEYLSVYGNGWTTLDVSKLTNLKHLMCFSNNLTKLDLSNNPYLVSLSCYGNNLTELDLSNLDQLEELDCSKNKLKTINISPKDPAQIKFISVHDNAFSSIDLSKYPNLEARRYYKYDASSYISFSTPSSDNQTRRMMLYTDGSDAYMNVEDGIDVSRISNAQLNLSDGTTTTSTPLTFSLGTASNGMVPLKLGNSAARMRLFNTNSTGTTASTVTITYTYNTGSKLTNTATMNVTDTVECYLLPMSQEYGSVNLPYNVLLPTGATAYAVSGTSVKPGRDDNTATLTQIASEGEVVAANTPMLIRRADANHTMFALNQSKGTAKSATSKNLLKGTNGTAIDNQTNYFVLGINNNTASANSGKLGFWRSTSSKIGNWRAYLDLSSSFSGSTSAKGFVLLLDTTPTGISTVATERDGAKADTPWYTLDGRTLGGKPSQRGVYIHNGKKMVISE